MLISVIVTSYNHGQFLEQRLQSIVQQTYRNFEIIIIDDFSTDNSREIIEQYRGHEKVKHIVYKNNNSGSPFKQWKLGFQLAKGEFIWIAESDDLADERFLEKLTAKFTPETSMVYCKSKIIDANNNDLGDTTEWLSDLSATKWDNDFTIAGIELFSQYHAYKNIVSNSSSVIFRKSALEKIAFYPDGFKTCGDWLFFAQIGLTGDVAYSCRPLNYWRQHDKSTRNAFSLDYEHKKLKENRRIIRIFQIITKEHKGKLNFNKYKWLLDWWLSRYSYKNLFKYKYFFAPLPYQLLLSFYVRVTDRTSIELKNSIKKKFKP